jgi:hypothetical protein
MEPVAKSGLKERLRKIVIVAVLIGSLLPALTMNIGSYAQQAGLSGPIVQLNQSYPEFHALLLCQMWGLFGYISPFNYTIHYEVELPEEEIRELVDLKKIEAGSWQSILFHNESKADNNMYADHRALRGCMEYLIRTNGIDPATVVHRKIYIHYRNVYPRKQAATAGTHYGPEVDSTLETY